MIQASLILVAVALFALGVFVWTARPESVVNRRFAICASSVAGWTIGIAGVHSGILSDVSLRFTFACASLAPPAFLAFVQAYPVRSRWPTPQLLTFAYICGAGFALASLATELVAYEPLLSSGGLSTKTGYLYPYFAAYAALTLCSALTLLVVKWRAASGVTRVQLQHLSIGAFVSVVGGLITNLVLPLAKSQSAYGWIGPHFLFAFLALVAHAIIRHRLMDLRLVIHHGLTVAVATMMSLCPVAIFVSLFWPQLSSALDAQELIVLVAAIVAATLLVPPTRDIAGKLIDRYAYRTRANFQATVRDASRRFTGYLDLGSLLSFAADAIAPSTESEGIAIYLAGPRGFSSLKTQVRHQSANFLAPEYAPQIISEDLAARKAALLLDDLAREGGTQSARLCNELAHLNWALVLPFVCEDTTIGFIALGPKLSGDPFYPQDLDLLMTLVNQAGTAIKNVQLYTEVVLANEYIENIVGTIESGVVAIDYTRRIAMFNRAAEQLTGLSADDVLNQPLEALPANLGSLLAAAVADGRERTEPEMQLQVGSVTRPVICTTSPLRKPTGSVLGAVSVFSDLTPFKQLEDERRRAERLAYFEVLASSLAHEIKNPLVSIKTFAQLIPLRHKDERFVTEFSRIVTREIGRMERLIERLRVLSRPSDRPKVPLDLREPMSHAIEFLRPAFDEKGITLSTTLGNEPRIVVGDLQELEQLFINLLMNAHEATPPGGHASAEVVTTGSATVVRVTDSGPGIPTDLLDHVFDPFVTSKAGGSGLGLTISAGIASAHRAKLLASNPPGGGALFTLEFPLAAQAGLGSEIREPGMNAHA